MTPVNPVGHVHVNSVGKSLHVALFIQGSGSQKLISERKKRKPKLKHEPKTHFVRYIYVIIQVKMNIVFDYYRIVNVAWAYQKILQALLRPTRWAH